MVYKNRMKEIRTYDDISQKEVAKIMNISPYTYSHYETEDTIIPLKHLITFCDYFNVSIDYIFELTDKSIYDNYKKGINLIEAGNRLKSLRKEKDITQVELAQLLNIARSILSEYEKGHYLISLPTLLSLSKLYNVSCDYLLGKINSPKYLT